MLENMSRPTTPTTRRRRVLLVGFLLGMVILLGALLLLSCRKSRTRQDVTKDSPLRQFETDESDSHK